MSSIDARAYLHWIRNIHRGVRRRTEIIRLLDTDQFRSTSELSKEVEVTYSTILYHLRNMEREGIVESSSEGFGWRLGRFDQEDLTTYITKRRRKKKK